MPQYTPPLRDIQFVLHEVLDAQANLAELPQHADVNRELIDQVLEEGGKFCAEVLFPLNRTGDEAGCRYVGDGVVQTPEGFKQAWEKFKDGGWPTLTCDPQFGGQGLPYAIGMPFQEMLNSANQAWAMYPGLTHGAYDCLREHGTPQQKAVYLPEAGVGAMDRHHVPDRGALRHGPGHAAQPCRTPARRQLPDHRHQDLHLLRRTRPGGKHHPPGAGPATGCAGGHQGYLAVHRAQASFPTATAIPASATRIRCARIEEKMGIHGNATCVMDMDGASGWMVAQPNRGLQAMFVMMNAARIGVGLQTLGLMEVAYQNSLAYAKERIAVAQPDRAEAAGQARRPDHRASGCASHAADAEGLHRGQPRLRAVARAAGRSGGVPS